MKSISVLLILLLNIGCSTTGTKNNGSWHRDMSIEACKLDEGLGCKRFGFLYDYGAGNKKNAVKAQSIKGWSNIDWETTSISDLKINKGADINAPIGILYNSSPLQMAVSNNENLAIIKFLITNGANVNYKNKNNATAVYFSAAFNKNPKITALLIDKGADVNIKDYNGVSALSYAAEKSQKIEIINILIAAGADVNTKDIDGETPLHDAVLKYKDTEVINAIISAGSDINAKTNNGETILYWGIKGGNLKVVEFLIAKGADINAKTNNGETPLYLAIQEANLEIIKFLIEKGVDSSIKKLYLYAGKLERQENFDKAKKLYIYIVDEFSGNDLALKANDRLISLKEQQEQKISAIKEEYRQYDLRREKDRQLQKLIGLQEDAKQQRKQDLLDSERVRRQDIKDAESRRKKGIQQRKNSCIKSHNQCVKRCGRLSRYGESCDRDCILQRRNSCNNNCYAIARSSGCT
jgi:ankyrin repeat protein